MTDVMQYARPADSELEQWARDLQQAYTASVRLVTTSFVPQSYKGKPEEAAAAIMAGAEVGLSPMASLRAFDIIQGTPAPRAVALRALAQSHGHDIWTVESTKTRAIVRGQRQGSEHVEESVWTIERARDLGLLGKDNWKRQPIAMLLARATSECARLVAADVILGVPYSAEEIEDGLELAAAIETGEVKPPKRTVKRAPLKVAEPEPEQPQLAPGELPDESPMVLDPIDDWEAQERAQADAYLAEQHDGLPS